MDDELQTLAFDILNTIEREDFIYAVKHYFIFKIQYFFKTLEGVWSDFWIS